MLVPSPDEFGASSRYDARRCPTRRHRPVLVERRECRGSYVASGVPPPPVVSFARSGGPSWRSSLASRSTPGSPASARSPQTRVAHAAPRPVAARAEARDAGDERGRRRAGSDRERAGAVLLAVASRGRRSSSRAPCRRSCNRWSPAASPARWSTSRCTGRSVRRPSPKTSVTVTGSPAPVRERHRAPRGLRDRHVDEGRRVRGEVALVLVVFSLMWT